MVAAGSVADASVVWVPATPGPDPLAAPPGTATGAFSDSHAAASGQWSGTCACAPTGASRPSHAGATATDAANTTTIATATDRSRSGCASASATRRRPPPSPAHNCASRCATPSTIGSRSSGSNLCTLRSGAPEPSRNARTVSARPPPAGPTHGAVIAASPTAAITSSRPRAGIPRRSSPTTPAAATTPVASTKTGSLVSAAPAMRSVDTNGTHAEAPRNTSVTEDQRVVTSADSMWSRNGGETRPSSTSGTAHHRHTAADSGSHHAARRAQVRSGRCMAHHRIAGRHATAVATALTAPISASASAAPAPPRRGDMRPCSTRMTGSSTHGASATGQISEEMDPRSPSMRGANA